MVTTQTTQPEKKSLELSPDVMKMLETLRNNWTVVDDEASTADEIKNDHSSHTLITKAIYDNMTVLPSIYSGTFRKCVRKCDFVVPCRYSNFHSNFCVLFGDLIPPCILSQYTSQGATSFTLNQLEITYFATPLSCASTGASNIHYVSGEESYHRELVPVSTSSLAIMTVDLVTPISSAINCAPMVYIDIDQNCLRKIFCCDSKKKDDDALDAGFDVSVHYSFFINGLGQSVDFPRARRQAASLF